MAPDHCNRRQGHLTPMIVPLLPLPLRLMQEVKTLSHGLFSKTRTGMLLTHGRTTGYLGKMTKNLQVTAIVDQKKNNVYDTISAVETNVIAILPGAHGALWFSLIDLMQNHQLQPELRDSDCTERSGSQVQALAASEDITCTSLVLRSDLNVLRVSYELSFDLNTIFGSDLQGSSHCRPWVAIQQYLPRPTPSYGTPRVELPASPWTPPPNIRLPITSWNPRIFLHKHQDSATLGIRKVIAPQHAGVRDRHPGHSSHLL
ncbi:hypothetical protein BKA70DRAFT_1234452 [Coprinopsis sp. MPI-PUGE-AT-0042]|nr:hypothetical protein BKA70DRAFT_1234452 [Coprinopsis sp. MPI-PUGE-AT-0042]